MSLFALLRTGFAALIVLFLGLAGLGFHNENTALRVFDLSVNHIGPSEESLTKARLLITKAASAFDGFAARDRSSAGDIEAALVKLVKLEAQFAPLYRGKAAQFKFDGRHSKTALSAFRILSDEWAIDPASSTPILLRKQVFSALSALRTTLADATDNVDIGVAGDKSPWAGDARSIAVHMRNLLISVEVLLERFFSAKEATFEAIVVPIDKARAILALLNRTYLDESDRDAIAAYPVNYRVELPKSMLAVAKMRAALYAYKDADDGQMTGTALQEAESAWRTASVDARLRLLNLSSDIKGSFDRYRTRSSEQIRQSQIIFMICAIIGIVAAIGTAALIQWIMRKRLAVFVHAADTLNSTNFGARIDWGRNDELQPLGDAFDSMAEGIQERDTALTEKINQLDTARSELRKANEGLENRVKARTRDLETVNRALQLQIEDRKRIETDLRGAKEDAEQANRTKSEFLANMSHEIRTPMNGVLGMTDLLAQTSLTAGQKRFVEAVRNSGEALLRVINDILDFSKIEADQFALHPTDFDLRALVEDTVYLFRETARRKNLQILTSFDEQLPAIVHGDDGRLRQVLDNLIGNAIKFTTEGEVEIIVGGGAKADDRLAVSFQVRDTGIGISKDAIAHIFRPFQQADTSTTRRFGGTGLGLVIAQQIIEKMGGAIQVESEDGKGSAFSFTISLQAVEHGDAGASPEFRFLDPASLLVVAENEQNQDRIRHIVQSWGNPRITTATTQELQADDSDDFLIPDGIDIAIVDRTGDGQPSDEVTVSLVQYLAGRDIAVALIQKPAHESSSALAQDEKIVKVVPHPLRRSTFCEVLHELVSITAIGGNENPADKIDVQFNARVLLVEDNPVNLEVATENLESLGCEVHSAVTGREGVEAWRKWKPDVILMDCQMPEMDGFSATQAIRQSEADEGSDHRVPIIALTALAFDADREKCKAAGMDDHLTKPFKKPELVAVLSHWLGDGTGGDRKTPAPFRHIEAGCTVEPDAAAQESSSKTFDEEVFDQLRALYGDNIAGLENICRLFLTTTEDRLKEMSAAVDDHDFKRIRDGAHAFKSSSASLGLSGFSATARALEFETANADIEATSRLFQDLTRKYDKACDALKSALDQMGAKLAS